MRRLLSKLSGWDWPALIALVGIVTMFSPLIVFLAVMWLVGASLIWLADWLAERYPHREPDPMQGDLSDPRIPRPEP